VYRVDKTRLRCEEDPKTELVLTQAERDELVALTLRRKTAQSLALRARIVLACADGQSNRQVGFIGSKRRVGQVLQRRATVARMRRSIHAQKRNDKNKFYCARAVFTLAACAAESARCFSGALPVARPEPGSTQAGASTVRSTSRR
jgi:hypothetical protein